MDDRNNRKIIGLLGVGFDANDGHVRITKGGKYDVYMGSDESHAYLQELMKRIEDELRLRNRSLESLTPCELEGLIESIR
jgi:hypothetical protein